MFTDKVKKCLTVKFDLGEQTGRKADPLQVSNHMRKAKDAAKAAISALALLYTSSSEMPFLSYT